MKENYKINTLPYMDSDSNYYRILVKCRDYIRCSKKVGSSVRYLMLTKSFKVKAIVPDKFG